MLTNYFSIVYSFCREAGKAELMSYTSGKQITLESYSCYYINNLLVKTEIIYSNDQRMQKEKKEEARI